MIGDRLRDLNIFKEAREKKPFFSLALVCSCHDGSNEAGDGKRKEEEKGYRQNLDTIPAKPLELFLI